MNFSQLGNELHMTRTGARAYILRNEKKFKKWLIYENKKPMGIKDEYLEQIRDNAPKRQHNNLDKQTLLINSLNTRIKDLENQIEFLNRGYLDMRIDNDKLRAEKEQLSAQLSTYQNMSFFDRLLGYKKPNK